MTHTTPGRFTRERPRSGSDAEQRMELLVLTYLRASGGICSHANVARFASRLRLDPEELDRALVRVERAGSIRIDPGHPACSENRTVTVLPSAAHPAEAR